MINLKEKRAQNKIRLSNEDACYAYVVSGHSQRSTQHMGCGVKVGQTYDYEKRFNQLNKTGRITRHCVFCCENRADAEWLEATLRRHFLNLKSSKRNGTDWIENVATKEYKLEQIIKDPCVKYVLDEINPIYVITSKRGYADDIFPWK